MSELTLDDIKKSNVWSVATTADKAGIILDMKHYSLESGSDAHVELFKYIIPALMSESREALQLRAQLAAAKELVEHINGDRLCCGFYTSHESFIRHIQSVSKDYLSNWHSKDEAK